MFITNYMGLFKNWKMKFKCYFMPKGKLTEAKLKAFTLEVYDDLNIIKDRVEALSQDQYAKAHLNEVLRLRDSFQSTLMMWDETIKSITDRLDKLEGLKK